MFRNVAAETQNGGLRTFLRIDREKMGRLGITAQNVDDTLNDAFGQRQISTIYAPVQSISRDAGGGAAISARPARAREALCRAGRRRPADADLDLRRAWSRRPRRSPSRIRSSSRRRRSASTSRTAPRSARRWRRSRRAEREIGLPSSIIGLFSADAAEFRKSLASEPWLILAAAIAIYVVLGVLYESYAHPFTVLTTLPSAGVGALLALMATGLDMSIVALIGVVLLMGIVKKNAIMMIDFALEAERATGSSPRESIVRACRLRFRPIMMTTLAALLGALPLALAHGAGQRAAHSARRRRSSAACCSRSC